MDPLVSTGWLYEHLEDPQVRVADIRGYVRKQPTGEGREEAEYLPARAEYEEAHVPGAVFIDWTADITDPEDSIPVQIAPPERFAEKMGSCGIGDGTLVVAYDHTGGQFATRLWWALTYYGYERVCVLDGGWKKWVGEGRPTSSETPSPEPATFTPSPRPALRLDAEGTLQKSRGSGVLLDARDRGQYTGELARGEGRAGRIPGAASLPAGKLFDPETETFRSPEELEERLRAAGVPEDRNAPVAAYCNGGVAATVPLFSLYRLGYTSIANYDGSWNEWGERRDLPAEGNSYPR